MKDAFELYLLGGPVERRYRRLRPDVERLPWGTLDPSRYRPEAVIAARRAWTVAAFQEHRTGAACAATLAALIAARAPVDLIAMATPFPLDELAHVEMCARIAGELGGGTRLFHDAAAVVPRPSDTLSPLMRAAELVVRVFCVGEAVSIPLLRGTWHAARHPLPRGILGRIVRDEAAHGHFGWLFLDWAAPLFSDDDRAHLTAAAVDEIAKLERAWAQLAPPEVEDPSVHALGWMQSAEYLALARRSLERVVRRPLLARGFSV
jgi:hypothetical protein